MPSAETVSSTRDTTRAQEAFVDGALKDMRHEYAEGILDYMEALKYDRRASIMYAIAKDYAALHKPDRAAQFADEAIALDSNDVEYRMLRAEIALTMQGDFDIAQRQLERVVALDSDNVEGLSELAELVQLRGNNAEAAALYKRVLDITGENSEISLRLAQIYSVQGNVPQAVQSLRDALKDEADNPELRESIAQAYVELHELDSATYEYLDLLQRYPNSIGAQLSLANVYNERGMWNKAFTAYSQLLSCDTLGKDTMDEILDSLYMRISTDSTSFAACEPLLAKTAARDSSNWYAWEMLGGAYILHGEFDEGFRDIRKAVASADDTLAALLTGGELLLENHRNQDILNLIASFPVNPDFRIELLRSYALEQMKDHMGAIAALHASLQLNPKDWMALSELGLACDEEHLTDESDSAYAAALTLKPDYALALNNYSYSLAERGENLPLANSMAQRAVMLDTGNVNYMDTYAWVLYKTGKYDSALVWIRNAAAKGNTPPTVLEHLGDIELKLGRCGDAVRAWNAALQQDSTNETLIQKISQCKQHGGE